jgi:hypothetical protein
MWPVAHAVSGQNLTHCSTMELVCARQVADGVTSQVGSYQTRLFGCVEPVLDLLWDLSRAVAFGLIGGQSPRLGPQFLMEGLDFQLCVNTGEQV